MIPESLTITVRPAIAFLDYAGMSVFAISGALLAAEKSLTFVTFLFFAIVTAVGGGTARDLLIGAPVFWVHDNSVVLICFVAALAVWLTPARLLGDQTLLWFDAAGLAAYATYGATKGLAYGIAPLPAFVMGVLTACLGGIIRDTLANEPSILMRPELYVTAAALAAGLAVALPLVGMPAYAAVAIATLGGFLLRSAAIARGWSLPSYRHRR